jgi:hypothetical protein
LEEVKVVEWAEMLVVG